MQPEPAAAKAPSEVRSLADRNEIETALTVLSGLLEADPMNSSLHLLRGQCRLATTDAEAALEDFRTATYLDPDHKLARCWYALTLSMAALHGQARAQLRVLERMLAGVGDDEVLEDGMTRTSELRRWMDSIREQES